MVVPKSFVAVLTQEPVNVTLLGERVFADAIKLRVLIREGDLTQGRLREGGGRARSDAVASPDSLEAPRPPLRRWKRQGAHQDTL